MRQTRLAPAAAVLAALLLTAAVGSAQAPAGAPSAAPSAVSLPPPDEKVPLDTAITIGRLPNGMRY